MTRDEAIQQLTVDPDRTKNETERLIDNAICHGAEREEVAAELGLTMDELMERHGLCVRNAGKLGHFRSPDGSPHVVDLNAD